MYSDSPWRISDFRVLFTATALSQIGTHIGYVAMPLIAVSVLDASPGQVGALATLSTVAFLLIGLPAGAWVDRMRHRQVLILADLIRSALFLSVPLAWWSGSLTLEQLYVVALLNGCATVFFDVGSQSVLPQLVGRGGLVQANAAVVTLISGSNVAGRGAGGGLVQLLTAPVALVCTAASFLGSALRLLGLRPTPAPQPSTGSSARLGTQIAEGVRHVFRNRELRALALTAAVTNLGVQIVNTVIPILFVRQLGLPEGVLGLFWAVGGAGLLLGARCARFVADRLGYGRCLGIVGLFLAPAGLLVPLVDRGIWLWLAGAGWLLAMMKTGMDNVVGVSLRQRMTSQALLGRMNASFRFLLTGALAIGSAVAGVVGQFAGVHTAIWVGGALLSVAFLPVFLSPLRTRRELPQQQEEHEEEEQPV
ncbi:MFS transporter [Actinopolyspora erythraea]|uniref:MFS transporter n=1 Tax=Actinopolyspora erythraea TaxID=414996 RepID=A0A099D7P5_9ACTN|nr:MFS transporter [Actinopolyspora erythraea]ASU78655.1 MFS transporter [Actinopolyspora erythraea]KGI81415.1 MFS transporter [Actinopolyspora erythraea]